MDTLSIRLRYRPLRIGWCVTSGDFAAMRKAQRLSCTLWGGRYNPILPVGDHKLTDALVRLFRVDALLPASDDGAVHDLIKSYKHLPWPLFGQQLFRNDSNDRKHATIVDILHPAARLHKDRISQKVNPQPVAELRDWDSADPLADAFLATFGQLPSVDDIGIDYKSQIQSRLLASSVTIPRDGEVQVRPADQFSIAQLTQAYMEQHYRVQNYWDTAGFYVGEADNFEDILTFWNLRAADIPLLFHDVRFSDRTRTLDLAFKEHIIRAPKDIRRRHGPAVWTLERGDDPDLAWLGEPRTACTADLPVWNGMNLKAPVMYFGEDSALAAVGDSYGRSRISFALTNKPFGYEAYDQHFVLSIDPGIGLFANERSTLHLPNIPELNEYYGRNAHVDWNRARAEPDSIGFIESTTTNHVSLRAIDTTQLISEIFKVNGIKAEQSKPGLVAASLIRQMGKLDDCRVFKIAGVRALIEGHKADQAFSRSTAKQVIRGQNGVRPISEYQSLYIEQRPIGSALSNDAVFSFLLDRGMFRAGLSFWCPSCQLDFWLPLDAAKTELQCEYCGHTFNGSRQLKDKDWAFRRSGLLGKDDNQEGSIPVVLTLQQLMDMHALEHGQFTTAMTLTPIGAEIKACETDFVVIVPSLRSSRTIIVIGECKTRKPITADDVQKLSLVADAFPKDRYDVFLVFSKLTTFTNDEIELARSANSEYSQRVILLTDRELEPMRPYERTEHEFDIDRSTIGFDDMARNTHHIFFEPRLRT